MPDDEKRASSKRTRGVIDRIEDDGAAVVYVGDDESVKVDLHAALLPEGASSGDHLQITVKLDAESRQAAEERVKALQEKLEQRTGAQEQKNFKL